MPVLGLDCRPAGIGEGIGVGADRNAVDFVLGRDSLLRRAVRGFLGHLVEALLPLAVRFDLGHFTLLGFCFDKRKQFIVSSLSYTE